jgi:hypothetical protein
MRREFFVTEITRGPRTLGLESLLLSLLTMRLASEAENMPVSGGELPRDVAVGLRRRCVLPTEAADVLLPNWPPEIRLIAALILMASSLSAFQLFSPADAGLLA